MSNWQKKLIKHLDAQGENEVRLKVDQIEKVIGSNLPESARHGPTRKHLADYWRTDRVLPALQEAGWTVDFTDYQVQIIGFHRLSWTGGGEEDGLLAATIQNLVSQARRIGTVTSIAATKCLDDGTSVTLSIEPGGQERAAPRERLQTRKVSPEKPVSSLTSTEAHIDSIGYDDDSMVHWPIDKAESDPERLPLVVRCRVTGIEEGQGLGGYGCLTTMSQKKSLKTKIPAIYSPRALGLRRVREEDALFDLVVAQKVTILAINGHGHDQRNSIQATFKNKTTQSVRVLVPAGTVFEQEVSDLGVQDLMLRDPIEATLSPGQRTSVKGYGLCMDKGGSSPAGEALLLTPWILSTDVCTQDDLWAVTEG